MKLAFFLCSLFIHQALSIVKRSKAVEGLPFRKSMASQEGRQENSAGILPSGGYPWRRAGSWIMRAREGLGNQRPLVVLASSAPNGGGEQRSSGWETGSQGEALPLGQRVCTRKWTEGKGLADVTGGGRVSLMGERPGEGGLGSSRGTGGVGEQVRKASGDRQNLLLWGKRCQAPGLTESLQQFLKMRRNSYNTKLTVFRCTVRWCAHHLSLVPGHSLRPKGSTVSIQRSRAAPSPSPQQTPVCSLSLRSDWSWYVLQMVSWKMGRYVPASFPWRNVYYKVPPCSRTCQCLTLLCGWTIFHCRGRPRSVCPPTVDGHWNSFQILAIVTSAAMNVCTSTCWSARFSSFWVDT